MPFVQNPDTVCEEADRLHHMKRVTTWVDDSQVSQPRTRADLAQRFLSMIAATLTAPSWWLPSAEDRAAAKTKWEGIAEQHSQAIAPQACAHLGAIAQGGSFSEGEAGALDRGKLVIAGTLGIDVAVSLHIIDPFSLAVAEASPTGAMKTQVVLSPPQLDVEAMGPDGRKVNLPLHPQGSVMPWVFQYPLVHVRGECKHEAVEEFLAYRRYSKNIKLERKYANAGSKRVQAELDHMTGTAGISMTRRLADSDYLHGEEGRETLSESLTKLGKAADAFKLVAKGDMVKGLPPLQFREGRVRVEASCMEFDDAKLDASWAKVDRGYLRIKVGYQASGQDGTRTDAGPGTSIWESAHRLVLWACRGPPPWPDRDSVCMHVCHNRKCLSPWHLYWGRRNAANTNRFSLSAVYEDPRTEAPEGPDGRDLVHDHNLAYECMKEELLATLPPAGKCVQRTSDLQRITIEARAKLATLGIRVSKECTHVCIHVCRTCVTYLPPYLPTCHIHTPHALYLLTSARN